MTVFSGRGVMVAQADSFPLSVAGPRMQRAGMGRLELLLWSGQPTNGGMVPAQLTQYQGAGLTVTGWSVHNPGEDHRAALTSIRDRLARNGGRRAEPQPRGGLVPRARQRVGPVTCRSRSSTPRCSRR